MCEFCDGPLAIMFVIFKFRNDPAHRASINAFLRHLQGSPGTPNCDLTRMSDQQWVDWIHTATSASAFPPTAVLMKRLLELRGTPGTASFRQFSEDVEGQDMEEDVFAGDR